MPLGFLSWGLDSCRDRAAPGPLFPRGLLGAPSGEQVGCARCSFGARAGVYEKGLGRNPGGPGGHTGGCRTDPRAEILANCIF